MHVMYCIRVLYKSVLSDMFSFFRVCLKVASSWDSLFRVQVPFLFGAAWAWIQVFWINLSFVLLEEITLGQDELIRVSSVFSWGWLVVGCCQCSRYLWMNLLVGKSDYLFGVICDVVCFLSFPLG